MIREHDIVTLVEPFEGMPEGTLGEVLMIYNDGKAFEVEFPGRRGETFPIPAEKVILSSAGSLQ